MRSPSMLRTRAALAASFAMLGAFRSVAAVTPLGHSAVVKRQEDLLSEYDFIVVGAGTAGLTVADRLTENGQYTVLVVEYGYLDDNPSIFLTGRDLEDLPNDPYYPVSTQTYNITTEPNIGLDGKQTIVLAASVVGGSSAINGMAFDRGSAEDYDAWVRQAGAEHEAQYGEEWGWTNLYPWFKMSSTFYPPSEELAAELNVTYDLAAWGGNTSLYASYAPFQYAQQRSILSALKAVPGMATPKEAADGNATGVFWFPCTVNPENRTRSYARTAHYDDVRDRQNYDLLPAWRVTQLIMGHSPTADEWDATGVLITPRDGDMPEGGPVKIKAKREIIVSAGSIHTPQVLQRSGIGPRDVIEAANGTVRVELPGVGSNLQDHMYNMLAYDWGTPVFPNPTNLTENSSYAAEADTLWEANKTGPYSMRVNTAAFLPLSVITDEWDAMADKILAQADDPGAYLPAGVHPTVAAGYAEQLRALARQYASPRSAVYELPFSGNATMVPIFVKPLSRGTVHISPDDDGVEPSGHGDAEPLVDYRTLSNPLDLDTAVAMFRFIRRFVGSGAMAETFHPEETAPGPDVASEEEIRAWIARDGQPSNGHSSGTARIGPRELGGVLAPDLTVHGVRGLSVADCSVMPLVPGTHTSSTAYAIAEKAADMVLRRATATCKQERGKRAAPKL